MQRRDRSIAQSLGGPLTKRVKDSRVLLVGAGGIGCEVLKNLVCSGFGSSSKPRDGAPEPVPETDDATTAHTHKPEIVVIDLDTIDLSNLNRQFLFRKQHIKRPKAFVAKETASKFNPSVAIDAHHASIFDNQYNIEFFESFDLVFNALDNLAARQHVNRMCVAANVPLIESGTTGFNGQVQAIQRGLTECYDCNPKPVQKSFPICTIRSTPSQPIHCIVWAKSYLLPELFGAGEEESNGMAVTAEDNAEEVAKLKQEAEALKNIKALMGQDKFAKEIFNKVFKEDIERLRSMTEMWKSRTAPEALNFESLSLEDDLISKGTALVAEDQKVWDLSENLAVFCSSLEALSKRAQGEEPVIEFDKDDKDTLDFVAAAANLRSHIFSIPLQSEWEIKQMAGNIIPAIATANALTASLCVLEGFKILRTSTPQTNGTHLAHAGDKKQGPLGGSKMVFLAARNPDRMMVAQNLNEPNPDCAVCSPVYAKVALAQDSNPTLGQLVDLLKEQLGYDEFAIITDAGIIYDPDVEDNLVKSLKENGIEPGGNAFIKVTDEADEPKADLALSIVRLEVTTGDAEIPKLSLLPAGIQLPLKPKKAPTEAPEQENGVTNRDDASGLKRKREAEEGPEIADKKAKINGKDQVMVIEDDGVIALD